MIGVNINDEDQGHDVEEAEEPIDYGMKAISSANVADPTRINQSSVADTEDFMPPDSDKPDSRLQYTKLQK